MLKYSLTVTDIIQVNDTWVPQQIDHSFNQSMIIDSSAVFPTRWCYQRMWPWAQPVGRRGHLACPPNCLTTLWSVTWCLPCPPFCPVWLRTTPPSTVVRLRQRGPVTAETRSWAAGMTSSGLGFSSPVNSQWLGHLTTKSGCYLFKRSFNSKRNLVKY